jgi:lysozyme family protein
MANEVLLFLDQIEPIIKKAYTKYKDDPEVRPKLDKLIDRLVQIEADAHLVELLKQAVLLNELSDILEDAINAVRHQIGNFLLPLEKLKSEVDAAAGKTNSDIRLPSAEEDPATLPGPGGATSPATPPAAEQPAVATPAVSMFDNCRIRDEWLGSVDKFADRIVAHTQRYRAIEQATNVPWWFVGILHSLENGNNFSGHLHNGDALTARTVQVPKGRPETGQPPFTWEESAVDALTLKDLQLVPRWTLDVVLEKMERYNGLGYRHRGVPSPYLWSGSTHYVKGKFTSDGHYDPNAPSKQVGGAVVLKRMIDRKLVKLSGRAKHVAATPAASLGQLGLVSADLASLGHARKELAFPGKLRAGPKGNAQRQAKVRQVQEWLSLVEFPTPIDGDYGSATTMALKKFQNSVTLEPTGELDEATWLHLTAPMRRAVAPLTLQPDSLNAAVVKIARQHLAARPAEVGGENRGPWVRLYMDGQQGEAQKWCAGFVCFIVAQAAMELGVEMPFPRRVGVDDLVSDGDQAGRFVSESQLSSVPQLRPSRITPGTIYVLRSASNNADWTHTGIVVNAGVEEFESIEGNTSNPNVDQRSAYASKQHRSYQLKDFLLLL